MTGAFLNALGILLGALFGLARREPLTPRTQKSCQSLLGALTVFCGLHLLWLSTGGSPGQVFKQILLAFIAVMLGNLLGRILGFQKISNRIGRHAAERLARAEKKSPVRPADGFVAASLLACAAPLGLIGAMTDGLTGYFFPLAIKGIMDGLAMTSFVKMFRWPVALAAGPVFLFLNGVAMAFHFFALPRLAAPEIAAMNCAGALIICAATLVILEARRVELANYLPALAVAPLLARWLF